MTSSTPPPPPPSPAPGGPPGPGGTLASWGNRVGAYFVDWLVAGVPAVAVVFVGALVGSTAETTDSGFSVTGAAGAGFILVGSVLGLVIAVWNYGFRQGRTGQTVGKSMVNIEVVDTDGQYLGVGMSLLRTLLMSLLGSLCFLNYLWPLWDDQNRAWHDMVVDSRVRLAT